MRLSNEGAAPLRHTELVGFGARALAAVLNTAIHVTPALVRPEVYGNRARTRNQTPCADAAKELPDSWESVLHF